ncbi:MAG: hypothetical protein P8Z68_01035 [Kineosporiaceae bacterium]
MVRPSVPGSAGSPPGRRRVAGLVGVAGLVTGLVMASLPMAPDPLYVSGVGLDATGRVVDLDGQQLLPGPRVIAPGPDATPETSLAIHRLAADQRTWLAGGVVPGHGTPWAGMVHDALLDIHVLTSANGATVAGQAPSWRYVWPRDASFAAVALARTGHHADAEAVLTFLQSRQRSDGRFEARYRPDRPGVPDDRGLQLDSTGWVLWAAAEAVDAQPPERRTDTLRLLDPQVRRAVAAAVEAVDPGTGLPPASPDFWEVEESRPTLGSAAPLLAGLHAGAALRSAVGDSAGAAQASRAAGRLTEGLSRFAAQGYPSHLGGSETDIAVAFLLPPFTRTADPAAHAALRSVVPRLRRRSGGLAPGATWKKDGVSWTPETAIVALVEATAGNQEAAADLLIWLDAHRTPSGALPEKVRADGSPAGTAPLTWTAAVVVLAADALDGRAAVHAQGRGMSRYRGSSAPGSRADPSGVDPSCVSRSCSARSRASRSRCS